LDALVEKSKQHFIKTFNSDPDPLYKLAVEHVESVEKWALSIATNYTETNLEILHVAIWLHDIGQFVTDKLEDHAQSSEIETRRFLHQIGLNQIDIDTIAHCVRAHRCRDIMPISIEAKILAVCDSASHFTESTYIDMARRGLKKDVIAKVERDYRDVCLLPGIQERIKPLYNAWKNLLRVYPCE
jgi:hypothetical protein